MTRTLTPDSPARVEIEPGRKGGITAMLIVPCYEGEVRFTLQAERDEDGDWRVYVPWFTDEVGPMVNIEDELIINDGSNGVAVMNGICYLGAPDVEIVVE